MLRVHICSLRKFSSLLLLCVKWYLWKDESLKGGKRETAINRVFYKNFCVFANVTLYICSVQCLFLYIFIHYHLKKFKLNCFREPSLCPCRQNGSKYLKCFFSLGLPSLLAIQYAFCNSHATPHSL